MGSRPDHRRHARVPPRSTRRWASGSARSCATRSGAIVGALDLHASCSRRCIGLLSLRRLARRLCPSTASAASATSLAGVGAAITRGAARASSAAGLLLALYVAIFIGRRPATAAPAGRHGVITLRPATDGRRAACGGDRDRGRHRRGGGARLLARGPAGGVGRAGVRARARQRGRRGRAGHGHRLRPLPLRRPGRGGRPAAPRRGRGHGAAGLGRAARARARRDPAAPGRRRPRDHGPRAARGARLQRRPQLLPARARPRPTWTASRTSAASRRRTRCSGSTTPPSAVSPTTCTATRRPGPSAASTPTTWTAETTRVAEGRGFALVRRFEHDVAYVELLAVHPDHAGQGLGGALLTAVFKAAARATATARSCSTSPPTTRTHCVCTSVSA